ncbi:unnamed protein product [Paramecium sonneborni]|uniref:Uncharacterized protein n=1 Tax=Paramecium sonneborni TaxID=65129 RepID=A0A8S1KHK2_9CILI|nr:unnamed protein product [Paramecium sonneborni]CAD8052598.1 unnamed protein product [Paramecium sonneborni]
MKKTNLKINTNSTQKRQNKENSIKSPRKAISPKNFRQKQTCPDLWDNIEKQSITSEIIFSQIFPNLNRKRLTYFQFDQIKFLSAEKNEIFDLLQQDDWIEYNRAGKILGEKYGYEQSQLKKWFDENQVNQTIKKLDLLKKYKDKSNFITKLFEEIDFNNTQELSYWDIYLHKDIYVLKQIIPL